MSESITDTTVCLDWLRYSVDTDLESFVWLPPSPAVAMDWQSIMPLKFYTVAFRLGQHGRVDINPKRPEQRKLITFSGETLRDLRASKTQDADLLSFVHTIPLVKVTRLDVAWDIRGQGVAVEEFWDALESRKVETPAESHRRVVESGQARGETVYLGSRSSDRMLRVYHKGWQQKTGEDWVRVELELKGKRGHNLSRAAARSGSVQAAAAGELATFARTGLEWFDQCWQRDDLIPPDEIGRTKSDWEAWLKRVVLPNVRKGLEKDVPGFREALEMLLGQG